MRALQVKAKRVHPIWGACANFEAMETSTRPEFRSMRQSLGESGNESFIPTRGFVRRFFVNHFVFMNPEAGADFQGRNGPVDHHLNLSNDKHCRPTTRDSSIVSSPVSP